MQTVYEKITIIEIARKKKEKYIHFDSEVKLFFVRPPCAVYREKKVTKKEL